MSSKRMFYIMAGLTALAALLLVGSFAIGYKLLERQSDKLVSLKLDSNVLDEQDRAVIQANRDIEKYKDLLTISKTIVPQDKDQAKTIREIVTLAQQSGVDLNSFTFNTSSLGLRTPQPASGAAGATPMTGQPLASIPSQAQPVPGMNGVFGVPIVVQNGAQCTYAQLIDFLSRLEQKRRTAQVSQLKINPDSRNPNLLTFTLTINIFVKP